VASPRAAIHAHSDEAPFQAWIVSFAKLRGWRYYHTYNSRRSVGGFPDLILIRGSQLVVLEVKGARGRESTEQAGWRLAFRGAGINAMCVWPKDEDFVRRLLQ